MKICPSCQTRYEEEILRFCIRDGSPLVEEEAPRFTELPGAGLEDDPDEVTIVRNSDARSEASSDEGFPQNAGIVIPASPPARPRHRASESRRPAYQPPAPQPNIFKVIVLTVICTIAVLAGIAGLVWTLRSDSDKGVDANVNANVNVDTNLNTNLNMNGFNFNLNTNVNVNANANANLKANVNVNANANVNANRANVNTNVSGNVNRTNTNVNVNANVRPRPSPAVNAVNAVNANAANRAVGRPPANATVNRPANRPVNRTFDAANATRPRNVRQ